MAKAADLLVKIGADISDFQNKFGKLQQSLKTTGKRLTNTGKSMTMKLTTPIVGLGAAVVKTTANFEKSMNNVRAISGATGKEFEALEAQARDLGASTVHSASEVADGMTYLAMAGFEVNEIMSAMPGMLDLATAGNLDLARTADIASNVLTGFSLEASEASRVSDVLAKSASSSNTNIEQLGDAMSYVAPVAQGAGLSLEETAGAVGMLSDAGIQGSRAGTALRRMISSLQNPTGATKKALSELGLSMEDVDPSANSLSDILRNLKDAGIDSSQAMQLVGDVAGPGLIAMLEQGGDGLDEFTKELMNSEGAAAEMADIMSSGMYGAFKTLTSAVESLAISFGEVLAPFVEKVAGALTKLVKWFDGLSENTKTVIAVIAGLVAVVGPLLVVLGLLMTVLGSLSAPIIAVVAGVAAFIAILVTAWNTSETFREIILQVWEAIKEGLAIAVEVIKELFIQVWEFLQEIWEIIQELWNEHGETILEATIGIFTSIYEAIKTALEIVWDVIQTILGFIQDFWDKHGETIMGIVKFVFDIIFETISGVLSGARDFIKMVLEHIKDFWDKHGDNIMKIIRFAMDFIGGIVSTGMKFIKEIMDVVWPQIKDVVSTAWDIIKSVTSGAFDVISGIIGFLVSLLTGDFAGAWESVKDIISGVWDTISGIVKGGVNLIIDALNGFIRGMNKIKFKAPDWVPIIGGKEMGINIPLIPKLAEGGVALGSTLAEIGEGAHPEMVVPLNSASMKPFANLIAKFIPDSNTSNVNDNRVFHFTIDPSNIQELERVITFFTKLKQTKRKGG